MTSRHVISNPYRAKKSDCGKIVLKPLGKATLTKCGDIMWEEDGTWTRENDTIRVRFRYQLDNRVFVVKKRKLYRVVNNSVVIKPNSKIQIEE